MKTPNIASIAVAAILLGGCAKQVATPPAAGWTGMTKPAEVIHARQQLMEHIEALMKPIDLITVGTPAKLETLHEHADMVGAMLGALPHLFPPTTNLYDPKAQELATLALPSVWESFDSFYALAGAAKKAAEEMAATPNDNKALRAASLKLRAACDACHALYLRKYVPSKVEASDVGFDFDSALPAPK